MLLQGSNLLVLCAAPSAPGVIELKAEKQRADQQAGLKPKPPPTRTMDEDDAASGWQSWLSRNKPIAAVAAIAFAAVCAQSLGIADVKQAVLTLLSPITIASMKVQYLLFVTTALERKLCYIKLFLPRDTTALRLQ